MIWLAGFKYRERKRYNYASRRREKRRENEKGLFYIIEIKGIKMEVSQCMAGEGGEIEKKREWKRIK